MPHLTLSELKSLPGVTVNGVGCLNVFLGDGCITNLGKRVARLYIDILHDLASPRVSIEDFTGSLHIRIGQGAHEIRLGSLLDVSCQFSVYSGGSLAIGDHTSINGLMASIYSSTISIGRDCMLSHQIHMQPHGQHALINLNSNAIIPPKEGIIVDDHVWIGHSACILPGVRIANGSIIGANSVVTKDCPPCVAVAGNPAKIVRENCTWSRAAAHIDNEASEFIQRLGIG